MRLGWPEHEDKSVQRYSTTFVGNDFLVGGTNSGNRAEQSAAGDWKRRKAVQGGRVGVAMSAAVVHLSACWRVGIKDLTGFSPFVRPLILQYLAAAMGSGLGGETALVNVRYVPKRDKR
jgi:hypothetical protein